MIITTLLFQKGMLHVVLRRIVLLSTYIVTGMPDHLLSIHLKGFHGCVDCYVVHGLMRSYHQRYQLEGLQFIEPFGTRSYVVIS